MLRPYRRLPDGHARAAEQRELSVLCRQAGDPHRPVDRTVGLDDFSPPQPLERSKLLRTLVLPRFGIGVVTKVGALTERKLTLQVTVEIVLHAA